MNIRKKIVRYAKEYSRMYDILTDCDESVANLLYINGLDHHRCFNMRADRDLLKSKKENQNLQQQIGGLVGAMERQHNIVTAAESSADDLSMLSEENDSLRRRVLELEAKLDRKVGS